MTRSTNATATPHHEPSRRTPLPTEDPGAYAEPARDARQRLILRLAADRLRELQDDGVTFGYIARMYETDAAALEQLYRELNTPRIR